jgi:hypothetical protein
MFIVLAPDESVEKVPMIDGTHFARAIAEFQNPDDSVRSQAEQYFFECLASDPDTAVLSLTDLIASAPHSLIAKQCLICLHPYICGSSRFGFHSVSPNALSQLRSRILEFAASPAFSDDFHALLIADLRSAGQRHYSTSSSFCWPELVDFFAAVLESEFVADAFEFWADALHKNFANPVIHAVVARVAVALRESQDPIVVGAALRFVCVCATVQYEYLRVARAISRLEELPDVQFDSCIGTLTAIMSRGHRRVPDEDIAEWARVLISRTINPTSGEYFRAGWLREIVYAALRSSHVAKIIVSDPDFPERLWAAVLGNPQELGHLYETAVDILPILSEYTTSMMWPSLEAGIAHPNPHVSSAFLRVMASREFLEPAFQCAESNDQWVQENGLAYIKECISNSPSWIEPLLIPIGEQLVELYRKTCNQSVLRVFEEWCATVPGELLLQAQPVITMLFQEQPCALTLTCAGYLCQHARKEMESLACSLLGFLVTIGDREVHECLPILPSLVRSVVPEEAAAVLEIRAKLFFEEVDFIVDPAFRATLSVLKEWARQHEEQIWSHIHAPFLEDDDDGAFFHLKSQYLEVVPFYAEQLQLGIEGVRFWGAKCAGILLDDVGLHNESENAARCFLALFEQNSTDIEFFNLFFETVLKASQRNRNLGTLYKLVECLEVIVVSEFVLGDAFSLLVSTFVPIFHHFMEVLAAEDFDPEEFLDGELQEIAESFADVFDKLFCHAQTEMTAIAVSHFLDAMPYVSINTSILPFFELVWAELIACPTSPVDHATILTSLHSALRTKCGIHAHRRLADYYARLTQPDAQEIHNFLVILFGPQADPSWLLSALTLLVRFGPQLLAFEDFIRALLATPVLTIWKEIDADKQPCLQALHTLGAMCPGELGNALADLSNHLEST